MSRQAAPYAGTPLPPLATACPANSQPCAPICGDTPFTAPHTGLTPRGAVLLRLGWELRALRQEAARLRNLRRCKAASAFEADARRVVFEILALGRTT